MNLPGTDLEWNLFEKVWSEFGCMCLARADLRSGPGRVEQLAVCRLCLHICLHALIWGPSLAACMLAYMRVTVYETVCVQNVVNKWTRMGSHIHIHIQACRSRTCHEGTGPHRGASHEAALDLSPQSAREREREPDIMFSIVFPCFPNKKLMDINIYTTRAFRTFFIFLFILFCVCMRVCHCLQSVAQDSPN